ncbi:uncharacterized protein [Gossypium hirsutum]|uniref:RNase H type-1 domain-containing protein n=1 Tax=Gossypium hirsutum TaxID=3635 RepID=A0A1U8PW40_GOSHI|nr:uncharacterized protein LOC107963326 [Gossypium hirsutum]
MDFHEWLSWILKMHHTTKHNEICVTLWAIWFARNHMVHEGTNQSVGEIVSFIRSYCVKLVSVIPTNKGVVFGFQVRWSLPPTGVVKINVDAGFRLNQKTVAARVVIRDKNEEILGACCKITYPVLSIFATEVVAVIHRLRFAKELGFLSIIVKGDSRSIIRKTNNHEHHFSGISALTWSAKEIAKEFYACAFHFISKSRNKTAHAMVQEGLSQVEDGYWVEDGPALVEATTAEDCRLHEPL